MNGFAVWRVCFYRFFVSIMSLEKKGVKKKAFLMFV